MDEIEYFTETEDFLRDIYHTARIHKVDGENDFMAGQRNLVRQTYRLDLKSSVVQTIKDEREQNEDEFSDTLQGLIQRIEDKGLVFGEYAEGHVFVTAEYNRRDDGGL